MNCSWPANVEQVCLKPILITASETRPRLNKHTLAKYKHTHKACGLWLIIHLVLLFLVESFNFMTVEQLCI